MRQVTLQHTSLGGTGIVNIHENDYDAMVETVKQFNNPKMIIDQGVMAGPSAVSANGSLHWLGEDEDNFDLDTFWELFEKVVQSLNMEL